MRYHLQDLIGPGQAQTSFIERYVESRFPHANAVSSEQSQPQSISRNRPNLQSRILRPRRAEFASSSSSGGSIHINGADDLVSNESLSQRSASSRTHGGVSGSKDAFETSASSSQPSIRHASSPASGSGERTSQTFHLAPSAEMTSLDDEIKELVAGTQEPDVSRVEGKARRTRMLTCFCQGRKHLLFQRRPICLHCGLLQCSLNSPSPFSPEAACASCGEVLLSATDRSSLLSSLIREREQAEKRAIAQAERVRRERERVRAERLAAGSAATASSVDVFPELSGGDAASRRRQQEVAFAIDRKQGPIDLTGRCVGATTERKHKVLTIGKKGKVTIGSKPPEQEKGVTHHQEQREPLQNKDTGGVEGASRSSRSDDDELECMEYETRKKLGIVVDFDDDGFRQWESTSGGFDADQSMQTQDAQKSTLRYISLEERRQMENDDEDEAESARQDGSAAPPQQTRSVLGAATNRKVGKNSSD